MITLHFLEQSRAHRILWLLEELNIPYEIKLYKRNPQTYLAPPELKNVHPSGKSPVIEDGDRVIAESGLIIEYLVDKFGRDTSFAARNEQDGLDIKYGLYACESNLMITAMQLFVFSMAAERVPFGVRQLVNLVTGQVAKAWAGPELRLTLKNLNDLIKANGGYHTGGRLTGADVMYDTSIELIRSRNLIPDFESTYPDITAWAKRNKELPKYKKAVDIAAKL